jgi:hypothetical protein
MTAPAIRLWPGTLPRDVIEHGSAVAEVERLWTLARARHGNPRQARRPSPGIAAVVLALHQLGTASGTEVARRAAQSQPNVTTLWLPRLESLRFTHISDTVPGIGHQGGGRPAQFWRLTRSGRELAEALRRGGAR